MFSFQDLEDQKTSNSSRTSEASKIRVISCFIEVVQAREKKIPGKTTPTLSDVLNIIVEL